jgi:hypothetical protein
MRYVSKQLQNKNIINKINKLYLQILTIIIYNFKKNSKSV